MPIYRACASQHVLVPVVNDIWVCECPAVYKKQGAAFLDPARAGMLDAVIKLTGDTQGIAAAAKAQEAQEQAKRSKSTHSAILGHGLE